MSESTIQKDELEALVIKAVQTALATCNTCPIPEIAQKEIGHVFGMIQDVGSGSIAKGLEVIRFNHEFTAQMRTMIAGTAKKIYYVILLGLLTAVGTLIVMGTTHWIQRIK